MELGDTRVRLVGVHVSGLEGEPLTRELFADPARERRKRLEGAVGAVNDKFGGILTRASLLDAPERRPNGVGVAREDLAKVVGEGDLAPRKR